MSTSDAIFLVLNRSDTVDDAFWDVNVPGITDTAKAILTTRIKSMQALMNSKLFSAASLTSQIIVEGQLYIIMVTR